MHLEAGLHWGSLQHTQTLAGLTEEMRIGDGTVEGEEKEEKGRREGKGNRGRRVTCIAKSHKR